MTLCTIMAEVICNVIRIGSAVKIALVTAITIQRCILIAIGMTSNALNRRMSTCQRESGLAVIEGSPRP